MCDLKEFLYSILRHWRILIIVSIVSVLVGSGYYYLNHIKDQDNITEDSLANDAEDSQQDSAQEEWEQITDVYVGQLKFVAVGNEYTTSDVIRDAYLAESLGVDFFKYMREHYFENASLKYVREIVVPSNGNLSNYLGIDVYYFDEEKCNNIIKGIVGYLNEQSAEMSNHLGEHELFLIAEGIDEASIGDYSDKIKAIQSIIKKDIVADEVQSFSVKKMAIYGILFFIMANACACFIFILKDSLGDCIYNSRLLSEKTNSEILGDFSRVQLKGKIDRKIYDILITGKHLSELGSANFANYKLKRKYAETYDYLLVGKVNEEFLNQKADILMQACDNAVKFSTMELIDEDARGIEKVKENQVIIYMVRRFHDNKKEVIENINIYKELGIEIAGILFV